MRRWLSLLAASMLVAAAWPAFGQTNFVVSDYTSFTNALATTTTITNFAADAEIGIGAGQTIIPTKGVIIDGGSKSVIFTGSNIARIFHFKAKTTNRLANLEIVDGSGADGGAIYNEGTLTISNCVIAGNSATNVSGVDGTTGGHNDNGSDGGPGLGAAGGAIFSTGRLAVFYSIFTNNTAKGGNGGNGGDGVAEFVFGGNGGSGGVGGGASGGAIYSVGASNYFYASSFQGNTAVCGAGGLGGSAGSARFPGAGGTGGVGGTGSGGALFCGGVLRMDGCFFQDNGVTGGATAPAQGSGNNNPRNGNVGGSAEGGAVFLTSSASGSCITNCTFLVNLCTGGLGGSIVSGTSGDGGNGGAALGGGVASAAALAQIQYCTLATNFLTGGVSGGSGASTGQTAGEQVYASTGYIRMVGSIVSGGARGSTENVFGVIDGGFNLSSDSSGISQSTSVANHDPLLTVEVGVVATNVTVSTNGVLVTNLTYPTTNFDLPVGTNFTAISNTTVYPSNQVVFDLTTNALIPNLPLYSYLIIGSYYYTNTAAGTVTNTTYSTNFVAGSNGGPTPTLSLSNGSPALEFVTGIPGISFPLTDQRLYYRVSPTALGALDPNGVPGLLATNYGGSNNYTLTVTDYATTPPSFQVIDDVTSFSTNGAGGTNLIYTVGSVTTNIYDSGTNITFKTNSVRGPPIYSSEFATNIPTPMISGPSVFGLGQGAMLTASVATNVTGVGFQWQLNSTNLTDNGMFSGTATSNLTVKSITARAAGNYTVIAGTTLAYVQTSAVHHVTVTNLPRLVFTAPAAGARTAANPLTVRGTVTLASTVTNIAVWLTNLNDGSFTNVSMPFTSTHSVAAWSASFSPRPGTNLLAAWTIDRSGNPSPTVTEKFFSIESGQLTLLTQGLGTIIGATDKSKLNIGQTYTLAAHPGAKSLFGNWTVVTNGVIEIAQDGSAALHFLMEPDTVVTATFVTNMFLPAPSVYNGLFYPTGTNTTNRGPVGIITGLTVGGSGAYSAKIFTWGSQTNRAFAGVFSSGGFSSNYIVGVTNSFILGMTNQGSNIVGEISIPSGSSQLLLARLAPTAPPASYTMLFLPEETNAAQGYGYALITKRGGATVISGALADGTPFAQSVGVGVDGEIPFYVPLYTNGGFVSGWIPPTGEFVSNLFWVKPTTTSGLLFPAGFSNYLSTLGARWEPSDVSSFSNGTVLFTNGGLTSAAELPYRLTNGDRLLSTNNRYFGAITPNNGLLRVTNGSAVATGVVVANTKGGVTGGGFFLTTTNSGAMVLTPNP